MASSASRQFPELFDRAALRAALVDGVSELHLSLAPLAVESLLDYLALIVEWNAVHNLTAVREPAQMVTRHLLDSLAVAPHLQGETLADIGSGAGLPGIPLAVALPRLRVWLVESNGKKARFLQTAVQSLNLQNVEVVHARAEANAGTARVDAVVARAVASLEDLVRYAGPWLAPGGRLYAMKGPGVHKELSRPPPGWTVQNKYALSVPGLDAERNLVVLSRTQSPRQP